MLFGKKIKRKEKNKLLLVKESEEQEISPLFYLRYNSELLDTLFIIGEIMKMKNNLTNVPLLYIQQTVPVARRLKEKL